MSEFLAGLTAYQAVFFVTASSSTLILLIQTILAALGFTGNETDADGGDVSSIDAEIDTDIDIDADIEVEAEVDGDSGLIERGQAPVSDNGFKLFTVKGILSFLMMGGWVGFLLSRNLGGSFGNFIATVFAVISGAVTLFLMAKVMQWLMRLQSDGTLKIKNALGQTGQVYIRIPANEQGMGKVNVTVQERLCEFDAVTEESEMIKTGEMVYVTDVRADNVLVVEKVKEEEIAEEIK